MRTLKLNQLHQGEIGVVINNVARNDLNISFSCSDHKIDNMESTYIRYVGRDKSNLLSFELKDKHLLSIELILYKNLCKMMSNSYEFKENGVGGVYITYSDLTGRITDIADDFHVEIYDDAIRIKLYDESAAKKILTDNKVIFEFDIADNLIAVTLINNIDHVMRLRNIFVHEN